MSIASKKRIARNQGRIEMLACQEIIASLVERGLDRKKIFEHLQKEGSISMAYSTFCKVFAKMQPQKQMPIPEPSQKLPALALPGSGPQVLGKVGKESVDPKKYSNESLTI